MHSAEQTRTTRLPGSELARSTTRSLRPITVSATCSLADQETPYLPSPRPSTPSTQRSRSIGVPPWPTSPPGSFSCVKSRKAASGASQSLTLAAELRHAVSIDRIRKLERQLPPSRRSPAVRRLREQLAAVA